MTQGERKLTPQLLDHYKREGLRLRREAQREACLRLARTLARYAVAPFAFGRRMCSSSRGRISTKLQGR